MKINTNRYLGNDSTVCTILRNLAYFITTGVWSINYFVGLKNQSLFFIFTWFLKDAQW